MRVNQTFKRNGELYTIYKIKDGKAYAENEFKTNILRLPLLQKIK